MSNGNPATLSKDEAVPQWAADEHMRSLERAAKTLAVLALQSKRYSLNREYQQAVDDVLTLTREVRL